MRRWRRNIFLLWPITRSIGRLSTGRSRSRHRRNWGTFMRPQLLGLGMIKKRELICSRGGVAQNLLAKSPALRATKASHRQDSEWPQKEMILLRRPSLPLNIVHCERLPLQFGGHQMENCRQLIGKAYTQSTSNFHRKTGIEPTMWTDADESWAVGTKCRRA